MSTASVTEFREKLSEIVEDIASTSSEWTITKNGRPVAVLLSFDEYEALVETLNILSDDETMAAIDEGLADLDNGHLAEA